MRMTLAAAAALLFVIVAVWGWRDRAPDGASAAMAKYPGDQLILVSELSDEALSRLYIQEEAVASSDIAQQGVGAEAIAVVEGENEPPADGALVVKPEFESEPFCAHIGNFDVRDGAVELADLLRSMAVKVVLESAVEERPGPFMVYISAMKDFREARSTVRALKAQGFDSYIIAKGEYENAVSLGVFRDRENAQELAARVGGYGYAVRMRRMMVETELFYLLIGGEGAEAVNDTFWDKIPRQYPEVQVVEKSCAEVASEGNFQ